MRHGFLNNGFMRRAARLALCSSLGVFVWTTGLGGAHEPKRAENKEAEAVLGVASTSASESASGRKIPMVVVYADRGSFQLTELRLTKARGSTKLKGWIFNNTGRRWTRAAFELRAYDRQCRLLKGAEEMTLFEVRNFSRGSSVPLDYGYGVWLEGIPIEAIARVEAVLIKGQPPTAKQSRTPDMEE